MTDTKAKKAILKIPIDSNGLDSGPSSAAQTPYNVIGKKNVDLATHSNAESPKKEKVRVVPLPGDLQPNNDIRILSKPK